MFGDELRRWRGKRNLSLAGLAKAVHYSKGYLSKIENGDKPVTADVALRCDEALEAGGELVAMVPVPREEPPVALDDCPYRGLAAFEPADARWFFGRERATATLVERLTERLVTGDPVVVVAPSGAGKSSLLRAGLVPALQRGVFPAPGSRDWPVAVFTPTADPLAQLARFSGTGRVVLIVDQFEETFTLCPSDEERARFITELCALAHDRALVVLGVRADFYGHLLAHPVLVPSLQDGQVALGPLGADELRAAITRPARLAGLTLEPGLIELLIRDLGGTSGTYEPGALPLLSHALLTTWQNRTGGQLTVAGYQLTGGIHTAVATTAERTYARLGTEQDVARRLLLRLVHVDREAGQTRRRLTTEQVPAEAGRVLAAFVNARLLTSDDGTVEITHEALLTAWPRLRDWIEADRLGLHTHQRLAEAAQSWQDRDRSATLLYQGSALAVAAAWAADHRDELSSVERDFLAASQRERQRGVRRLRRLVALLSVLVLLAGAAVGAAVWQSAEAGQQRDIAVARKVAGRAAELRGTDPSLAMQLAIAADRHRASVETRSAVLSSAPPFASRFQAEGDWVEALAHSPDDRVLAVGTSDGAVELWDRTDLRGQTRLAALPRATGKVWQLAFHPTGHVLVTTGDQPRLWDVANPRDPKPLGALSGHRMQVRTAAFTPDGARLVTTSADGLAQLWNTTDPANPALIVARRAPHDIGTAAAITPDGRTLLTAQDGGRAVLWDLGTLQQTGTVPSPRHTFTRASYSPDGRYLALANDDGDAWLSTVETGELRPLSGGNTTWGFAFSADSSRLVSVGNDRAARIWDTATLSVLMTLKHPNRVLGVALSRDGSALATGGIAGNFHLWHDPMATISGQKVAAGISADRTLLITSAGDTANLWDISASTPVALGTMAGGHTGAVTQAVVSADNKIAATVAYDHDVALWNIARPDAPQFLGKIDLAAEELTRAALRPDGKILVTGTNNDGAIIWNLADPTSPRELHRWDDGFRNVNSLDFSPDGSRLVTGDTNHGVKLWNLRDPAHPELLAKHLDHSEAVAHVRFANDGTTVISTGLDWSVRIWTPGKPPVRRTGHTEAVVSSDVSPDGTRLLTSGSDGTIRLWDFTASPPAPLAVLSAPSEGALGHGFFLRDNRTILTAHAGHTRLWDTDPDAVTTRICALAGRDISRDEWLQHFDDTTPHRPPCAR